MTKSFTNEDFGYFAVDTNKDDNQSTEHGSDSNHFEEIELEDLD
jgi:hypothetical protein